jgi:hypothetical protein
VPIFGETAENERLNAKKDVPNKLPKIYELTFLFHLSEQLAALLRGQKYTRQRP